MPGLTTKLLHRGNTMPHLFTPVISIVLTLQIISGSTAYAELELDFDQGYDISGFSYSVVPLHQGESDMDNGGSYSSSSARLHLGYFKLVGRGMLLGTSVSYSHIDYNFTNPAAFGGASPWDKVRSFDLGIPLLGNINEKWFFMLAPSIGSYGEYGAKQGDSRTYGAVLSAGYRFAPKRKIGFGLGAFDRLGESKLFPFLSINWQLNDQLRLSNPVQAGPTGAAGLELAYSLKHGLEAGAGIARRNLRFRLDDSGTAANGIGEQIGRLLYLRLTKTTAANNRLGVYLGVVRKTLLQLSDSNGNLLASTDAEVAPLLALSFSGQF